MLHLEQYYVNDVQRTNQWTGLDTRLPWPDLTIYKRTRIMPNGFLMMVDYWRTSPRGGTTK